MSAASIIIAICVLPVLFGDCSSEDMPAILSNCLKLENSPRQEDLVTRHMSWYAKCDPPSTWPTSWNAGASSPDGTYIYQRIIKQYKLIGVDFYPILAKPFPLSPIINSSGDNMRSDVIISDLVSIASRSLEYDATHENDIVVYEFQNNPALYQQYPYNRTNIWCQTRENCLPNAPQIRLSFTLTPTNPSNTSIPTLCVVYHDYLNMSDDALCPPESPPYQSCVSFRPSVEMFWMDYLVFHELGHHLDIDQELNHRTHKGSNSSDCMMQLMLPGSNLSAMPHVLLNTSLQRYCVYHLEELYCNWHGLPFDDDPNAFVNCNWPNWPTQ